jgi:glycerate-2-kinase
LLKCGADINEINTIRKHLSQIKGGQLAKLTDATIVSLIISDIVNDPIEFIASGPTHPDTTTYSNALEILEKYELIDKVPKEVLKVLEDGKKGEIPETPKSDDPIFKKVHNFIIANIEKACSKAIDKASELGYHTKLLSTSLTGEAKIASIYLLNQIKKLPNPNTILISGGETTVKIQGNGKGGRNQELILAGIEDIADSEIVFASFATDGIDGKSDAAGAIADGLSLSRAKIKKLDPTSHLENNNSYVFFKALKDIFITDLTGTNVMDIQLIIN